MTAETLDQIAHLEDPSFLMDPYPTYARLRKEAPVWWCDSASAWVVSRYEDVRTVLRDARTFSSAGNNEEKFGTETGMIILTDPPKHRPARRIFMGSGSFSSSSVRQLRSTMRKQFSTLVLDLPRHEFDVVTEIAFPAVVQVFERVFGLPEPAPGRWSWKEALLTNRYPTDRECITDLLDYFDEVMAMRRRSPTDDAISLAVMANDRQTLLTDEEMAWNFYDAILAGAASTIAVTAEAIGTLAKATETQDPKFWDANKAVARGVEELLRWVTHIHWTNTRTATHDVGLGDQVIKAGDSVIPLLASANRDEGIWDHAEMLDLTRRPTSPHLAFGFGPHVATGAGLARAFLSTLLPIFVKAHRPFRLIGGVKRVRQVGISTPVRVLVGS